LKSIILGLGNPLFSDDAVGLLVARSIKYRITDEDVAVAEATAAGLDVLDIITGYEKAIIVDAVQTSQNKPGTIYRFELDQFSTTKEECPHNIDFLTSCQLGKKLGLALPAEIIVFGIEVENISDLNEECTPLVKAAIPDCVDMIMAELKVTSPTGNLIFL
jgi:hydrogenase maturation protease